MEDFATYYDELGVSEDGNPEEIRAARNAKIREFHPDHFADQPDWVKRQAHETTVRINEAYEVLSDPEKKTTYDGLIKSRREELERAENDERLHEEESARHRKDEERLRREAEERLRRESDDERLRKEKSARLRREEAERRRNSTINVRVLKKGWLSVSIVVGDHIIEANGSLFSETVKYDGEIKASGFSLFGASHAFNVTEFGERVEYVVTFKSGLISVHHTVRRNGVNIFPRKG